MILQCLLSFESGADVCLDLDPRLFLAASLGAVQAVTIAQPTIPRPKVPFREATAILDIKIAEAAIGRIKGGSVGLVLCVDGSVQLFGCSSGEICAIVVPSLRHQPLFKLHSKLVCAPKLRGLSSSCSLCAGTETRCCALKLKPDTRFNVCRLVCD